MLTINDRAISILQIVYARWQGLTYRRETRVVRSRLAVCSWSQAGIKSIILCTVALFFYFLSSPFTSQVRRNVTKIRLTLSVDCIIECNWSN